jgi:GTP cyclohydrolase I
LEKKLQDAANLLVEHLQMKYQDWDGVKQFKDTPRRLIQMYEEFCWPPQKIAKELEVLFRQFEDGYDEMLVTSPISVWTLCPHHLLPCEFHVIIGYVPSKYVLGLSKFVRIAEVVGRRPIMQEQYSRELASILYERLKPKGVAVFVVGNHGCMMARGVKQKVDITTSTLKGVFMDKPESRNEFYAIARTRSNEH